MAKKPIITSFLPESGTARYSILKRQYYQNQTQTDRNQSDIRQICCYLNMYNIFVILSEY